MNRINNFQNDNNPCPICAENGREIVFVTRDRHYKIKGSWNVGRCVKCGLIQLTPMLRAEELMELYPKTFYAFSDKRHSSSKKELIKRFFFPTLLVKDAKFSKVGKVLDYGCGTGWALLDFKKKGWECVGIEPSNEAATIGREQLDLNVITGTIHSIAPLTENSFDYIRTNHALEHDPDIDKTLSKLKILMKPNGKLLIGVPNINSLPARIFKIYWWYIGAPVHTYNYTIEHLDLLLKKNGFQIINVRYCGNFTGTLGSLQIYLNRNNDDKTSLDGWLINFPPFMILGQLIAGLFNLLKKGDAIEVTAKPQ